MPSFFDISVAAGTHTWSGSPLLLIPLAGYIALRAAMDTRGDVSSVLTALPVLAGLTIGSTHSITLNVRWGWHAQFVSITPAMVLGSGLVVTVAGELWRRLDVPWRFWISGGSVGTPTPVSDGGRLEPSISLPDRRATAYVVGIGLLVFGLSLVYVPGLIADTTYAANQRMRSVTSGGMSIIADWRIFATLSDGLEAGDVAEVVPRLVPERHRKAAAELPGRPVRRILEELWGWFRDFRGWQFTPLEPISVYGASKLGDVPFISG